MKLVFIFFLGAHKFAESTERGTGVLQSTFAMAASGQMPVTTLEEGWQQLKSQAIEPLCKELDTGFKKGLSKEDYVKVYT